MVVVPDGNEQLQARPIFTTIVNSFMKRNRATRLSLFRVTLAILLVASLLGERSIADAKEVRNVSKTKLSTEAKIAKLISSMTLEEKAGQLNLLSFGVGWGPTVETEVKEGYKKLIRAGKVGAMLNAAGVRLTKELQKVAVEETRLRIPLLFGFDVVHGFKTIFPISLAQASSWDPAVVEFSARAQALEASAAGLNWTYAPMVDIARDPRWGRIAEGAGEDPYLGAVMAAAWVKGFQGDQFSPHQVLACVKHFAAYGAAEGGRDYNTADLSERTLREIYLPPFRAAVDAGVESVMCSFNEIAGIPSSASPRLLRGILRDEWNFKGLVVSDWNAIAELVDHGVASTQKQAAMLALNAGVDMDMVSRSYVKYLPQLVKQGKISEETLNDSVRRVLKAKFNLGLFEDPFKYCDEKAEKETVLSSEIQDAALTVARKSIVLLKNLDNLLPLKRDVRSIAVIGPLAHNRREPLHWHLFGDPRDVVSVLDGIRNKVTRKTNILYAKGCEIDDESKDGFRQAVETAESADVVVLVLGEEALMSGEAHCRSTLMLPGVQNDLAEEIFKTGKPIVLILMNGRPLSINWINEHIPAIVEAWFLGIKTGTAIADVLFGDYNPSGKLPVTFPRRVGQIPAYYNHKKTGRPGNAGNPYSSKYVDVALSPLFPFGYGLSYTKFDYGELALSARKIPFNKPLKVSAKVSNVGQWDGEEVVQLYVQDECGSVTRPVKELKGFQKVFLKKGESKVVTFTLTSKDLAFYNQDMKYAAEPGIFRVYVGTNSADVQEARFALIP